MLLPGQSAGKKDPPSAGDFPGSDEPSSSSSAPAPVPGLPVTEGEFPIQQTPLPESAAEPPVPEAGEDTDSDATVDYREDSLLALVAGDDVPSLVPLDGDGFASWLTKQDIITPEMQRKYAKEIRAAKLEEFKSYLDNDAIRLTDRRKLGRDINFLTGRWVLTVKVDKNGYFSKFKARWVCRGFQDKFAWDQQTDSPTATRYGFPFGCAVCGQSFLGPFALGSQDCFPSGGTLQSVISHGCGSIAPRYRFADMDGRTVPSASLWSERCTAQVVEPFRQIPPIYWYGTDTS